MKVINYTQCPDLFRVAGDGGFPSTFGVHIYCYIHFIIIRK